MSLCSERVFTMSSMRNEKCEKASIREQMYSYMDSPSHAPNGTVKCSVGNDENAALLACVSIVKISSIIHSVVAVPSVDADFLLSSVIPSPVYFVQS